MTRSCFEPVSISNGYHFWCKLKRLAGRIMIYKILVFGILLLSCNVIASEDELIKETLSELSLKEVPVKLTHAELELAIEKQLTQKFPQSKKDEIIKDFEKKFPVYKVGSDIEYSSSKVKVSGKLSNVSSLSVTIGGKRYLLNQMPKELALHFNGPQREKALKKEVYLKFTFAAQEYKDYLSKELPKSSMYAKYIKLLNKKKTTYHEAKFDSIVDTLKETSSQKAKMNELVNYYKDHKAYLSSRKSIALKVYRQHGKADSLQLFNHLKAALQNKEQHIPRKISKNEIMKSIVLIEGENGVGTGSLADYYGLKCIISNRHVFVGNETVKITDIQDRIIKAEGMVVGRMGENSIAKDVMLYGVSDDVQKSYSFIPVGNNVEIDKASDVFGNSLGQRVITSIPGNVVGIGPRTIEVNNKFVSGNSGSPIIQNGMAVGIATYASKTARAWTNAGTKFSNVRRFGVKISAMTIEDYQVFDLISYKRDIAALKPFKKALEKFLTKFEESKKARESLFVFFKNNQTLVRDISYALSVIKKHKFTEVLESEAKMSIRIAEDILQHFKNVKEGKEITASPKVVSSSNSPLRIKHEFIRSLPKEYRTVFMARADFDGTPTANIRITSFAKYRAKSLTLVLGAFHPSTHEAYFTSRKIQINKSIKPRETLQYKLDLKKYIPAKASDVRFYIAVSGVNR